MSLRTARALTAVYFTAMLLCVTWPGMTLFSQVYPLVLGLPFSMAWIAGWITGSVLVLYLLDRVEKRARDERSDAVSGARRQQRQEGGA